MRSYPPSRHFQYALKRIGSRPIEGFWDISQSLNVRPAIGVRAVRAHESVKSESAELRVSHPAMRPLQVVDGRLLLRKVVLRLGVEHGPARVHHVDHFCEGVMVEREDDLLS